MSWSIVCGASEGLGAAFADALAARKSNLILVARRAALLDERAEALRAAHGVEVETIVCDLADPGFGSALTRAASGRELEVAVYNAAASTIGPLLDRPLDESLHVVDVNVRGPLRFVHAIAPQMVARGRGGIVLMSSIAGFQGAPRLAVYAASKAFNIVLGESLWAELAPRGVDVVVSCAGAIRTPGYLKTTAKEAPGTLAPAVVAARTLAALGHGPMVVPGGVNKLARFFIGRLLSRRGAVGVMAQSTAKLT